MKSKLFDLICILILGKEIVFAILLLNIKKKPFRFKRYIYLLLYLLN